MKRILTTLCALAIVMVGSIPTLAAEATDPSQSASYYPIQVEEYLENEQPRIRKEYQLSLSEDPSLIPTGDFERDGRLYYLLDMTRKDEVGVDTKPHIETITMASDTDDMEKILQLLEAQVETTTEDGYTGMLNLDHTTVKVAADGYATKTQALSATRSYPNLSDADVSLIPKTIQEKNKTLTLADVQWESAEQMDGDGAMVTRYTATASYTGSSSYQYATGYTVTADYSGEVAKTGCSVVTYTAIFGSMEAPEKTEGTEGLTGMVDGSAASDPVEEPAETSGIARPLAIGGVVLALGAGGVFLFKKIKERR